MSRQIPATQLIFFLLAALPCLIYAAWLLAFDFGLVDDAYIPLVYVRNVLDGHGVVFYPGGERVEGFTSPLWVGFMLLAGVMGALLPTAAKALSAVCGLLCLVSIFYVYCSVLADNTKPNHSIWAMLAGAALACDVSFIAWSTSGLETSLFTLAVLWLVWSCFANKPFWLIFLFLLIVCLTRPEGAVFIAPVIVHAYLNKTLKQAVVWGALIWLVPMCLMFLARFMYFGDWLPNTFYAKHDFGGLELVYRGALYLFTFLTPRPLLWIAFLWVLIDNKRRTARMWLLWIGIFMIAVVLEGGDHFALHRFFTPILPLWTIASIRVIQIGHEKLRAFIQSEKRMVNIAFAAVAGLCLYGYSWQLFHYEDRDEYRFSTGARRFISEVEWTKNWLLIGEWLKERYPEGTTIAVSTAGAIPFASELPCIDLFGLNTKEIARTPIKQRERAYPGHEKSNPDYVLGRKPAYIQLFPLLFFSSREYPFPGAYHSEDARREWLESMIVFNAQNDLWNHPAFQEQYEFKTLETEHGFISIFERKDLYD